MTRYDCRGNRGPPALSGSRIFTIWQLRLAGVKTYGAASAPKHELLRSLRAIPIDYRAGSIDRLTRAMEPAGVDYAFDGVGGANTSRCIGALRRGGTLVGFGFHGRIYETFPTGHVCEYFRWSAAVRSRGHVYGITKLYRKDPQPLREDLPKIFALLAATRIDPLIQTTFPLHEARQAIELLASGSVEGKIVLTNG